MLCAVENVASVVVQNKSTACEIDNSFIDNIFWLDAFLWAKLRKHAPRRSNLRLQCKFSLWWHWANPVGKYTFKVSNITLEQRSIERCSNVILLTLNRYLPTGKLSHTYVFVKFALKLKIEIIFSIGNPADTRRLINVEKTSFTSHDV